MPAQAERVLAARDIVQLVAAMTDCICVSTGRRFARAKVTHPHPFDDNLCVTRVVEGGIAKREEVEPLAPGGLLEQAPGGDEIVAGHNGEGRCEIVVPLVSHARVEAIIVFEGDRPGEEGAGLGTEEYAVLDQMRSAALAVLPLCLEFENLRNERYDLLEIFEAASQIHSIPNLEQTPSAAVRLAAENLGFDRCLVMEYDAARMRLRTMASIGFSEELPEEFDFALHGGLLSRAFQDHRAEWHAELGEPLFAAADGLPAVEAGYYCVAMPLRAHTRTVGVFYGDHGMPAGQVFGQRLIGLRLFVNALAGQLEAAKLVERLATLAEEDALTGLANRRGLQRVLAREIARAKRRDCPVSMLIIDIDKFKKCNDRYGHVFGDRVLVATADLLRRAVRETDFVARYGGDEFVVVMPDTTKEEGRRVSERVQSCLRTVADDLRREDWEFTLSLGLRSSKGVAAAALLEAADKALYQYKEERVRQSLLQSLISSRGGVFSQRLEPTLRTLLSALVEKDEEFQPHSRRVMKYCMRAAAMADWPVEEREELGIAAMVHDIGKVAVPAAILRKPGPLEPGEMELVRQHPLLGRDLLLGSSYMGGVAELVAAHHERWDGNARSRFPAYPGRLRGGGIPRGARVLRIADTYDAIVAGRVYAPARPHEEAIEVLRSEAGGCFDPDLVELVISAIEDIRHSLGPDAT